jgi:hypothetical protein
LRIQSSNDFHRLENEKSVILVWPMLREFWSLRLMRLYVCSLQRQ